MKYKNVIWDFDGTLFNSYPAMIESFMMALREKNIEEDTKTIETLMKVSVPTVIEYIQNKYNCSDDVVDRFNEIRKDIEIKKCIPYEDTLSTLQFIINQGGNNFIFTHRDKSTIEILKQYSMHSLFTECVTKEYGFERKPSPDGINYLIDKYNLDKKETIMIGDRELDILSGNNASIDSCFFNNENKKNCSLATFSINCLSKIKEKN